MKKFFSTLIAVLMAVLLVFTAACGGDGETTGGGAQYTVSVKTQGGTPVSDVYITVSLGDERVDMKATDGDGLAVFNLDPAEYTVEVNTSMLRPGYTPARSYYLTRAETSTVDIVLNTSIIEGNAPSSTRYSLGDVMYDFTFEEVETGEEVTLSELLPEDSNKMVLINFFYDGCSYCEVEFPAMKEAYAKYEDDVEIVCIDPLDTASQALSYKRSRDLPFYVVAESTHRTYFGVSGYPTNVIVDRYGVICMIDSGGITDPAIFEQWFEKYTAADYEQDIGNEFELAVPDVENPPVEDIAAALNNTASGVDFTYSWDDTSIYNWPWIVNEADGGIMSTNATHMSSWSLLICNFTVTEGQVVAIDYKTSTENGGDYFYVILDGEQIAEASGRMDDWETLYLYVGDSIEEEHQLVFTYIKNFSGDVGDDTVYLRNMRITDEQELIDNDVTVSVCRQASTGLVEGTGSEDSYYENYITPVYNEEDGFYHVGTADGPLLFAEIRDNTHFGYGIHDMAYDAVNNVSLSPSDPEYIFVENYSLISKYAFYESALMLVGYDMTPVTQELKDLLVEIVAAVGNSDPDDNETEWLEVCRYYDEYGVPGEPMGNLLEGISLEYAIEYTDVVSGSTVEAIPKSPRGVSFSFTPKVDGSYLISTSNMVISTTGQKSTMIWMVEYIPGDETYGNVLDPVIISEVDGNGADGNAELVTSRLIAGNTYYFSAAFSDPNLMGSFDINIALYDQNYIIRPVTSDAYVGDPDTGEIWLPKYVNVSLNEDGYYYASSLDGLTQHGRILINFKTTTILSMVTDFDATRLTAVNVSIEQMINNGLFDFTETGYYKKFYDVAEQNYNEALEKYIAGGGTREDFIAANGEFVNGYETLLTEEQRTMNYTDVMEEYLAGINTLGYNYVDEQLVEILQIITMMDGQLTDDSWMMLCVYRESLV